MGDRIEDEADDAMILEMIKLGALAGSYSYWARKEPEAARGLNRMHAKTRAEHIALTAEFLARHRCSRCGLSAVKKG